MTSEAGQDMRAADGSNPDQLVLPDPRDTNAKRDEEMLLCPAPTTR